MRRIFEIFDRYATSVDMVATSEVSVSLTTNVTDAHKLESLNKDLLELASKVDIQRDKCIVAVPTDTDHFKFMVAQLEAFGRAVRGMPGGSPLAKTADGLAVMSAIHAVRRSAVQGGAECSLQILRRHS